ncbi:MAG: nicotinate-nucleotide adenylyltransferase [Pseudomonadota bacterium]
MANLPRGRARILVKRDQSQAELAPRNLRVGLLGGSFNPAHEGHRHISLEALRSLDLDQVWWLVSPQNPLKARAGMAPIEERAAHAAMVADHPRIRVRRIEEKLHTRFTIDTLQRLMTWHDTAFVWLVGADNLVQMPYWRHWRRIFASCPIAVFARSDYSTIAVGGKVARVFERFRLPEASAGRLIDRAPPAWVFIKMRTHPASSTAIRQRIRQGAWWWHATSEIT